jgi:hypothetical protein
MNDLGDIFLAAFGIIILIVVIFMVIAVVT